jgi:hypothetical protein
MNRQRSFSRKKGAGTSSVSVALNSLLENVLCSLAMLKDQIEFVDDELFSLQTKSTAALPVTSQLSHLLRVSELYSFCVFSCQKKLEELSVFAGLAKVEEQVLEPRQSGGAASVPDELSEFLRHFVVGSPVFRDLVLELYPESAEMIRVLCNHEVGCLVVVKDSKCKKILFFAVRRLSPCLFVCGQLSLIGCANDSANAKCACARAGAALCRAPLGRGFLCACRGGFGVSFHRFDLSRENSTIVS